MDAAKRLAAMRADRQKPYKKPAHGVFSEDKKIGLDGKEDVGTVISKWAPRKKVAKL